MASVEALYREAQSIAASERAKALWLHKVAVETSAAPRGWRCWLPFWVWHRKVEQRLARKGIFNSNDYVQRYPDVGAKGTSPIHHYLAHGMHEGRDGGMTVITASPPQENSGDIQAILASGLFDARWYSNKYEVDGSNEELVEDYLNNSIHDILRQPGPLFSGAYYALENTDTRSMNPLVHYIYYGMREGRRAFQPAAADAFMLSSDDQRISTIRDFLDPKKSIAVLYWNKGNFFFTDTAKYVMEILKHSGFEAQLSDDHRSMNLDHMDIVVVAPHEYCVHGPGQYFTPEVAARVVHVNLEQWHTSWFSLALDKMLTSRKALDINPLSARGLAKLGIKAGFLPLLPRNGGVFDFGQEAPSEQLTRLRTIKPLVYPVNLLDRPYDILFVGYLNKRRARALAELGHVLSEYDCFLHAPRFTGPITDESPNMIGSRDLAQIAQNAKLLLNVHQGESHYFEWHRLLVSGIAQGCVPLTEPCVQTGIVEPGKHYIEATLDEMPERITWLLDTAPGQREMVRIQRNGQKLLAQLDKQMTGYIS